MRSAVSFPTVTATPMITRDTMVTREDVCPLDRTWTCCGGTSGVAVMPARYWADRVPAGTVTRNRTPSWVCGGSVTTRGIPVTQQAAPAQAVPSVPKALPEFSAVMPAVSPPESAASPAPCC